MDPIVAAIQQAAMQHQICNASGMMGIPLTMPMGMQVPMQMSMPFGNGLHPVHYAGSGFEGPQFQPPNGGDIGDAEDEDDDEQARTLFCNNLDERVTEEILYEVFLQAGPIESARIPLDNTGRQRNFGFVTYQHRCAVPYAVELYQGLELFQKKVVIRQQHTDNIKSRNPFSHDHKPPMMAMTDHAGQRLARRSMHEGKQYNRGLSFQNKQNSDDLRRRSDSAVIESKRPRVQHQQHHNSSGGNRRSDQRLNYSKRRIL